MEEKYFYNNLVSLNKYTMPSEEDPIPAKRIRLDTDEVNEGIENEKKPGTT